MTGHGLLLALIKQICLGQKPNLGCDIWCWGMYETLSFFVEIRELFSIFIIFFFHFLIINGHIELLEVQEHV